MTMSGPVEPTLIRTLPTPQLALELLRVLSQSGNNTINANSTFRGAEQAFAHNNEPDRHLLLARLADAWAWLQSRALVGPHQKDTTSAWERVTDDGLALAADPGALAKITAQERLSGPLDTALQQVRLYFDVGDYETACFAAMKTVEVEVRAASGLADAVIGVDLMVQAFKPDGGVLADTNAHKAEQLALMQLFAGAIGAFKNPSSHRTVQFDDPVEAAEVIQLADLLLRLLRRAETRIASAAAASSGP